MKSLLCFFIIAGVLFSPALPAAAAAGVESSDSSVEQVLVPPHDDPDDEIIYRDDRITITQSELNLISMAGPAVEADAEKEDLVRRLVTIKVLVHMAGEKNIAASDTDFESYRRQIHTAYETADNQDDVRELFASFGGEDGYWETMRPIIMANLTAELYLTETIEDTIGDHALYSPQELSEMRRTLRTEICDEALAMVEPATILELAGHIPQ